ncbi:sugar lactone lactonase YvrE [Paenibacillus mucilaginosus]|uniref:YIP1 family protein n=1 Tax=Paenibacillus mucilaginosus TaxID=61624 RepID=UPI003D2094CE
MRNTGSWRRLIAALIILCTALMPGAAQAEVKYPTFTKDSYGNLIWLQPAYYPMGVLGGDLTAPEGNGSTARIPSPMRNPKDIFIDANNEVYIADTGNNRIVHMTEQGKLIRYLTLPESPLQKPEGVFVTSKGEIYIADTGNKRVVKLGPDGKLQQEFGRPDSRYISETFTYDPAKVMVDERGFLYIAVHGGYEGLVLLDPRGKFQGFFGANRTALSPLDALKRMLYTKQMYANEVAKKPETINSVATDQNGYIYTVTGGMTKSDQLKKLNTKGANLLRSSVKSFGESRPGDAAAAAAAAASTTAQGAPTPQLIDVAVDRSGNMVVVDQQFKYISHYDYAGNLLYFWGGPSAAGSSQVGLLKSPAALDINSRSELFVLDDQENIVQVFRLSEFGQKVDEANQLTLAGNYNGSEKPWGDVLRMNAQFTPAILGLAKAAFHKEDYPKAQALFKEAGDREGYSESFWQIRMLWFQSNFSWIASLTVFGSVLFLAAGRWTAGMSFRARWSRRSEPRSSFLRSLKHAFYILKHPVDGFTAVRYEGKGTYASALVLLAAVYLALVFKESVTGFAFNMTSMVDVYTLFLQSFIVWAGWVFSNHLVSSIYRGEGRFRDIVIGSSYVFVPYIVVGVPLALLSNGMTLSEESVYSMVLTGMTLWTGLLLFWKVQFIHNYSVGETVINIVLTLCTMLVIGVLLFVTGGLTSDLLSLIREMLQEVVNR